MENKNAKLYISDQTEAEKKAPDFGDAEVLIAGEKDIIHKTPSEKIGNQSKEYYSK